IKLGAFDYITKPLIPDEVSAILTNLLQMPSDPNNDGNDKKVKTNSLPEKKTELDSDDEFFEGQSPAAKALYAQVKIVADTNYSVILYGESGTGKEIIARAIHNMSDRRNKPFVAMDCGTLSKELSGSELFGHVK